MFLPVENLFIIESALFGTIVITLPLLVLFFARSIDGITGGNISVANAYLADISSDENRSKNFGKMAISSNLGFIVGPALAGILGATIYQEILPVLGALFLSLITLIVIGFALIESKPQLGWLRNRFRKRKVLEKFLHMNEKKATSLKIQKNLNFKMFSS